MIRPTVGRVLWYWNFPPKSETDQPYAATVAFVHSDRLITISYVNHVGTPGARQSVTLHQEGDPPPFGSYCTWMPYQVGQAKRHEAEPNAMELGAAVRAAGLVGP